jgi:hypothetical protein
MPQLRVLALLFVATAGCGGGSDADGEFRVPSESMLPSYNVNDVVETDSDPDSVGVGDVVVFHPPEGAELDACGASHPDNQACPEPTPNESDVLFIKRIVAKPGDRLGRHHGGGGEHGNERRCRNCPSDRAPNSHRTSAIGNLESFLTSPYGGQSERVD